MNMAVIYIVSGILACLPLLMAGFFLLFTLPRKLVAVKQDLFKLTPSSMTQSADLIRGGGSNIASVNDIDELAKKFFGGLTLSLPSLLLTLFYAGWFTWVTST
jgi:hypothetical protein